MHYPWEFIHASAISNSNPKVHERIETLILFAGPSLEIYSLVPLAFRRDTEWSSGTERSIIAEMHLWLSSHPTFILANPHSHRSSRFSTGPSISQFCDCIRFLVIRGHDRNISRGSREKPRDEPFLPIVWIGRCEIKGAPQRVLSLGSFELRKLSLGNASSI